MPVTRVLYVGQQVYIDNIVYPVQSASCEVSSPVDDVFGFGILGSAGRFQKEASSTKSDIKMYLNLTGQTGFAAKTADQQNHFGATVISVLTGNSLNGKTSTISVSPNGFTMSGILTNLSVDATNGSFVTISCGFEGVGDPVFSSAPATSVVAGATGLNSIIPVTSDYVAVGGSCVNSAKFSLDIPTDRLSCLGGRLTGLQDLMTGSQLFVGKPPFKTSLTVEGTSAASVSSVDFGGLRVLLPSAKTTSKSFNQSVGDVGANYSFTVEDVTAVFTQITPVQGT